MKRTKIFALITALCVLLSVSALAASGESSGETKAPVDRPAAEVIEGERYVSALLPGASALYVSGESVTLDDAYFYGAGYASDEEITDQIPNQFGMCAVVLAAGLGSEITLHEPTIVSDPESYANGVFASAMAKITIHGGTIETDNSSGHGIDATYLGHVDAYDTVIHTKGETSGALATDFGGGFICGERLDCTTEGGSSPGIFCAGSTIVLLRDSKLTTTKATGVVVAHDGAVVVLDDCTVSSAGTAISGLQALPSAAASAGSECFVFGGTLESGGAVVGESGGRTVVNLVDTECSGEMAIEVSGRSAGILTVNLWDTELSGAIECGAGSSLTVNVYDGGVLSGEVSGEGEIVINVYDGGEYKGTHAANDCGKGESAPVCGEFDDYLLDHWAGSSIAWTEKRAQEYVDAIEPTILENSAASHVKPGAAAVVYDPESYDPSENGIDPALLNTSGAHGFTVSEVFGSASGESSGEASGEASGETSGDAAEMAPSGKTPPERPADLAPGEMPPGGFGGIDG